MQLSDVARRGVTGSGRHSLRVRLPLLISALILAVLTTFLLVAYREVKSALVQAGGARAQAAADQLGGLLAQSAQQRVAEVRRVARTSSIRAFLQHPDDDNRAAARQSLTSLTTAGQPGVELWNAAGTRVLEVAGLPSANGTAAAVLPPLAAPTRAGLSDFHAAQHIVFYEAVADVREDAATVSTPAAPPPDGYVVVRRSFTATAGSDVIGRLVGSGAVVKIGNLTGDVWTDLGKVVPPPPVQLTDPRVQTYRAAGDEIRLGAVAPIRGTSWAIWVDFPYAVVVAPAWTFVTRMVFIGICFIAVAAVAARLLSARITTPLHDLTQAAEAIAAGEYSRRVVGQRGDEIGRLGAAFNAMTEKVEQAHHELEDRVEQRVRDVKEARAQLDRFFSLSLDLLCIAGDDGHLKRVNPAWESVLGWTAEELTSVPYETFVHPDDVAPTREEAAKLSHGATTLSFENRYRCKDGSYRWFQWKAVPYQAVVYAAVRDVTEQKRASRALQEHADALASVNQELEAFSYSVSHDLRAPLRHVTGFATLLDQRAGSTLDEQGRRYLKTMIDAANRMGRLIDDLLAFSRMGRAALTKRRISLARLVEDARREVEAEAAGRNIIWNIQALPDVDADPAMLRLALVNLLSNAVKYTGTRERAHIEVGHTQSRQSGETVVFVKDDGVGFDMQYAHKLFGVFQRLHRAEEFEGTGIGLANVRRIIQRHGGRIWGESKINHGATFFFSLPDKGLTS